MALMVWTGLGTLADVDPTRNGAHRRGAFKQCFRSGLRAVLQKGAPLFWSPKEIVQDNRLMKKVSKQNDSWGGVLIEISIMNGWLISVCID